MAEQADLVARIRALEDIEAIKRLKHKYLRCLDSKLWDELAECLTEDARADYADGELHFQGADAIMRFLRESLGRESSLVGIHHCHHPEIELTSDTTAKGAWALYNYLINKREKWGLRLGAYYHDEYIKEQGEWKISSTGYTRIFQETWDRDETPSLNLVAG